MSDRLVIEVVAALMKAPRTARALAEYAACDLKTVRRILPDLHAAGVVYISDHYKPDGQGGRWAAVWSMQPALFANPDAVPAPSGRSLASERKADRAEAKRRALAAISKGATVFAAGARHGVPIRTLYYAMKKAET